MSRSPPIDADYGQLLSAAMKAVRRKKGLRPAEVAKRMDLPLRTYEYVEAGKGGLTFERLASFGWATNSDPYGLLAALATAVPELALWVSDNKLAFILVAVLREFVEELGEQIAHVDTMMAVSIFSKATAELSEAVRNRIAREQEWVVGQMKAGFARGDDV